MLYFFLCFVVYLHQLQIHILITRVKPAKKNIQKTTYSLSSTRSISRGKRLASRIFERFNNFIVIRSSPKENPPSGGIPYLKAIRYISKVSTFMPRSFIALTNLS